MADHLVLPFVTFAQIESMKILAEFSHTGVFVVSSSLPLCAKELLKRILADLFTQESLDGRLSKQILGHVYEGPHYGILIP